jgi:hypothetical protein
MSGVEATVIIPTIGDDRRNATIWRAIESAGPRSGLATRILVIVNGNRFSPDLMKALRASLAVECIYVEKGSLPFALQTGRELVTSEFFAFLDDDDEFLEGGLKRRCDVLRADAGSAFVVSAGWYKTPDAEVRMSELTSRQIEANPLESLLVDNWMGTSASGFYRTSMVSAAEIGDIPPYLEWTYLGFRLASRMKFRFIDTPTYRRYDLPETVSKSRAFQLGMIPAIRSIIALDLPASVQKGLRRKLGAAHHAVAALELDSGNRSAAWRHHLQSLLLPGGLQYASYTRHLLRQTRPD